MLTGASQEATSESGDTPAPAAHLAEKLVVSLQQIVEALSPVIGKGGVDALLRRTFYLTGRSHPHLALVAAGNATAIDLAALRSGLGQQTTTYVVEFGIALLQTLDAVMTSLVGASLTQRLLGAVWSNLSTEPPAQDDPA